MPVQSGTYSYTAPVELTAESVQGATVGQERVRVPAGTFQARHVQYGGFGSGTLDWWLAEGVPGQIVRYGQSAAGEAAGEDMDSRNWTLELVDYGDDARSELGVL
jgi:hypothetical protein